jgi:putative flippase GtrA
VLNRLRSSELFRRLNQHGTLVQFIKYAIVGASNVALFLAIFNGLRTLGVHVLLSNAVAFLVASVNSFFWNKRWAFRDTRTRGVMAQYLTFLAFTLVGLSINTVMLSLFLIPLGGLGRLGENLAALGALPFSVAWNFASYRLWTFRDHSHSRPALRDSASA